MMSSKHPDFEDGRRTHVEYWVMTEGGSVTRCSDPDCELNEVG